MQKNRICQVHAKILMQIEKKSHVWFSHIMILYFFSLFYFSEKHYIVHRTFVKLFCILCLFYDFIKKYKIIIKHLKFIDNYQEKCKREIYF
jgi:hypothetical protein